VLNAVPATAGPKRRTSRAGRRNRYTQLVAISATTVTPTQIQPPSEPPTASTPSGDEAQTTTDRARVTRSTYR
jgi:hypothetical protein